MSPPPLNESASSIPASSSTKHSLVEDDEDDDVDVFAELERMRRLRESHGLEETKEEPNHSQHRAQHWDPFEVADAENGPTGDDDDDHDRLIAEDEANQQQQQRHHQPSHFTFSSSAASLSSSSASIVGDSLANDVGAFVSADKDLDGRSQFHAMKKDKPKQTQIKQISSFFGSMPLPANSAPPPWASRAATSKQAQAKPQQQKPITNTVTNTGSLFKRARDEAIALPSLQSQPVVKAAKTSENDSPGKSTTDASKAVNANEMATAAPRRTTESSLFTADESDDESDSEDAGDIERQLMDIGGDEGENENDDEKTTESETANIKQHDDDNEAGDGDEEDAEVGENGTNDETVTNLVDDEFELVEELVSESEESEVDDENHRRAKRNPNALDRDDRDTHHCDDSDTDGDHWEVVQSVDEARRRRELDQLHEQSKALLDSDELNSSFFARLTSPTILLTDPVPESFSELMKKLAERTAKLSLPERKHGDRREVIAKPVTDTAKPVAVSAKGRKAKGHSSSPIINVTEQEVDGEMMMEIEFSDSDDDDIGRVANQKKKPSSLTVPLPSASPVKSIDPTVVVDDADADTLVTADAGANGGVDSQAVTLEPPQSFDDQLDSDSDFEDEDDESRTIRLRALAAQKRREMEQLEKKQKPARKIINDDDEVEQQPPTALRQSSEAEITPVSETHTDSMAVKKRTVSFAASSAPSKPAANSQFIDNEAEEENENSHSSLSNDSNGSEESTLDSDQYEENGFITMEHISDSGDTSSHVALDTERQQAEVDRLHQSLAAANRSSSTAPRASPQSSPTSTKYGNQPRSSLFDDDDDDLIAISDDEDEAAEAEVREHKRELFRHRQLLQRANGTVLTPAQQKAMETIQSLQRKASTSIIGQSLATASTASTASTTSGASVSVRSMSSVRRINVLQNRSVSNMAPAKRSATAVSLAAKSSGSAAVSKGVFFRRISGEEKEALQRTMSDKKSSPPTSTSDKKPVAAAGDVKRTETSLAEFARAFSKPPQPVNIPKSSLQRQPSVIASAMGRLPIQRSTT